MTPCTCQFPDLDLIRMTGIERFNNHTLCKSVDCILRSTDSYSQSIYNELSCATRQSNVLFDFTAFPFSWKITAGFWISFTISPEKLWEGTSSGKSPRQTASCARYNVTLRRDACHTTAGVSLVNWTLRITSNTRRIWWTRKAAITTRQR